MSILNEKQAIRGGGSGSPLAALMFRWSVVHGRYPQRCAGRNCDATPDRTSLATSGGRGIRLGLALTGCVLYAIRSPRPCLQATLRDGLAAHGAQSVTPIGNPQQSSLDLFQAHPALLHECGSLGEFEGNRAPFRIVFVIDVRVLPGDVYRSDVPTERSQERNLTVTFLLKEYLEPLRIDHGTKGYRTLELLGWLS